MAKIRVLLADDHETVREGLRLIISGQEDMEVVGEASDGAAALAAAARLQPDVVVMDITMPKMNGLEATQTLVRDLPSIKVLTLTRHGDAAYLQQLLEAGVTGYVLKQSRATELLHAIRAVAAGGTYLDPSVAGKITDTYARRSHELASGASPLTPREEQVLRQVAWGYSNKEIAGRLELSVKTVETHKANAMQKLGARSRIDVVRFAVLNGWLHEQ